MNRSAMMAAVRSKNTTPEIIVRRLVHAMGYRFRLHRKDLPGTPDLVFPARHKVIFVHGCFWHHHGCKRSAVMPKSNHAFWAAKLERNRTRDARHLEELGATGWDCLTVWQCELADLRAVQRQIATFLERRNSATQI